MEEGVGVAGSGMGLGGNVKWPEYKARLQYIALEVGKRGCKI
jgi:hypothetical protein